MKNLPNQRKHMEGISLKPIPALKDATFPAAMGSMRRERRQAIIESGGKETTKMGHWAVTRPPIPEPRSTQNPELMVMARKPATTFVAPIKNRSNREMFKDPVQCRRSKVPVIRGQEKFPPSPG